MTEKINEMPKEPENKLNKAIFEAMKKNKDSLLDVERIVKRYFDIVNFIIPDTPIANVEIGLIDLSIIYLANKLIEDKEFIEWCEKNVKEKNND
jgi:hypothetical protein